MNKEPRSVVVAMSAEWLNQAGIPETLDDNVLADIIDEVLKESIDYVRDEYEMWASEDEITREGHALAASGTF